MEIKPLNLGKMNKKGLTLGDMYPAVLTIVLVGLVLGVGLYVLDQFADNMTGTANETVQDVITGLSGFSTWIAIIVTVIAAAIVLGAVMTSFGRSRGGI